MQVTYLVCRFKGLPICLPENGHQILITLSLPPEATFFPSGEKATNSTQSACPVQVKTGVCVCMSHIRTVLSPEPEASRVPSGLKLTHNTASECPDNGLGARYGNGWSSYRTKTRCNVTQHAHGILLVVGTQSVVLLPRRPCAVSVVCGDLL